MPVCSCSCVLCVCVCVCVCVFYVCFSTTAGRLKLATHPACAGRFQGKKVRVHRAKDPLPRQNLLLLPPATPHRRRREGLPHPQVSRAKSWGCFLFSGVFSRRTANSLDIFHNSLGDAVSLHGVADAKLLAAEPADISGEPDPRLGERALSCLEISRHTRGSRRGRLRVFVF